MSSAGSGYGIVATTTHHGLARQYAPHVAEGILGELCPRLCRLGEYSDLRGLGVEPGGQVLRTPFGFGS
jgi:hypothetical protein